MPTLFLSHASKDDALASELQVWLVAGGFDDLFIDHASIRGGDKWGDALRSAKASCRVVVCLVTANWLDSDDCFSEFLAAWYQGKRIIPLIACVGAILTVRQQRHFDRVRAEDQGFDVSSALVGGKLEFDRIPLVAELVRAGLRASGALAKVGLEPEAFEVDIKIRPSPFPGLESFDDTDADAAIFYGRTPEILRSLEDLREMRANGSRQPYAITGASGSGKSSLLRAGILPRLRRERGWVCLRAFRPGADPLLNFSMAIAESFSECGEARSAGGIRDELLKAWIEVQKSKTADPSAAERRLHDRLEQMFDPLRTRLDRPNATVLISLDQAEELVLAVGQSGDALADYLRASLCTLPPAPENLHATRNILVVLTVRTDALPALQASPHFKGFLARFADLRPVPMYRFSAAIEGPPARYGVAIEPGLVEAMIDDAPGEDALPLLAFALQRLWKQYSAEKTLRRLGYETLGKLPGLISDAAERALRGARPEDDVPLLPSVVADFERRAARTFVPPLAQVTDSGSTVRRVARLSKFDQAALDLLENFVAWRLLVKKTGTDPASATIEVAHEAIFRSWPRLRIWIDQEKARLQTLRDIEDAARAWNLQQRRSAYLDHRGQRLKQAQDLLEIEDFALQAGDVERDYLNACRKAQIKRGIVAAIQIAVACIVIFGGYAIFDTFRMLDAMRSKSNLLVRGGYPTVASKFAVAGAIGDGDIAGLITDDHGENNIRETGFVLKLLLDLPVPYSVNKYVLSSDGRRLVVKSSSETGAIWDIDGRRTLANFDKARSLANFYLSGDQTRLVTQSADNALTLWDMETGAKIGGSNSKIFKSAIFAASTPRMTTLSEDNTCTLWNLASGAVIATIGIENEVEWCALSNTGTHVLTRSVRFVATLWDANSGTKIADLGDGLQCFTCSLSGDAKRVFHIDLDGKATLFDMTTGAMIAPVLSNDRLSGSSFSRAGNRFITRSVRNGLVLWDAKTGERIADIGSSDNASYTFTPSGGQIFSRSSDGSGELRDSDRGIILKTFPAGYIKTYKFSRRGDRLAIITFTKAGTLWNSATGQGLADIGADGEVESIVFSDDGTRLSVGSDVKPGGLWDSAEARKLTDYRQVGAEAGGVFSHNTARYVSLSGDNYASLWDAVNGRFLTELGGEGAAEDANIDRNNRRVVTSSIASSAAVWDASIVAKSDDSKPSLRTQVCELNYDAIGVFKAEQRNGDDDATAALSHFLVGRPWHPCDWHGLMTLEGWAQALRYWAVRIGMPFDYRCNERKAFGHEQVHTISLCSQPKPDVTSPIKSKNLKSTSSN
jgi:WD40 repeat protein